MDDIRESIKELQYYKESIFKSRRSNLASYLTRWRSC
jgi:hypothetical protein